MGLSSLHYLITDVFIFRAEMSSPQVGVQGPSIKRHIALGAPGLLSWLRVWLLVLAHYLSLVGSSSVLGSAMGVEPA